MTAGAQGINNPTGKDIEELVVRFQAGDAKAYGALYTRFREVVFSVAMRIVRNVADAEDVVQNTFLRAWNARTRLRSPGCIRPWLSRIAANLAKSLCGSNNRNTELPEIAEELAVAPSAHDQLEEQETRARLHDAIDKLSPRQCNVISLRIGQDLSFKEIASHLGCTDVSARVNFLYGVRNLQAKLAA